jgi:hypothetical protein
MLRTLVFRIIGTAGTGPRLARGRVVRRKALVVGASNVVREDTAVREHLRQGNDSSDKGSSDHLVEASRV